MLLRPTRLADIIRASRVELMPLGFQSVCPELIGLGGGAGGGSPPTFVRKVDGVAQNTSYSTQTISSVQVDGTNKLLVVWIVFYAGSPSVSSVVFNTSESLTQLTSQNFYDTHGRIECWRLINPTTTTANVVITFGSSVDEGAAAAEVFNGVNQTTPLGTPAADVQTTSVTSVTVSPSSTSNDLLIDGLAWGTHGAFTPGGSQVERILSDVAGNGSWLRGSTVGGGAASMSWTTDTSTRMTLVGVAVKGL